MSLKRSVISGQRSAGAKSGFTLIELLVAASITVVLAGLMISITSGVMTAWNQSRGGIASSNDLKILQDQITADLESAILRRDGGLWFAATVQDDQSDKGDANMTNAIWNPGTGGTMKPGLAGGSLVLNPANGKIDDYRFGQAGMWVRFFSVIPDSNKDSSNLSAPRAIAYQIVRYQQSGVLDSPIRYGFFRSFARANDSTNSTFTAGYDLQSPAYTTADGTRENTGNIRQPNAMQLLANNVIDFGVRLFRRDATGTPQLIFPINNSDLTFVDPATQPEIVEVFIRVLTDAGASLIETLETTNRLAGTDWWGLALQNSRVISWRVELKAQPMAGAF